MAKPLAERVAKLELELAILRASIPAKKGWRQIVGAFADDPTFDEVLAEGRAYRESTKPKPRKRAKASDDNP